MGRAMRWLRSLFGMRKEKENSNSSGRRPEVKKMHNLDRPGWGRGGDKNVPRIPATTPSGRLPATPNNETEKEQSQRAIAVAAATAAAADAAVAAAQAAVAVVRLTSYCREATIAGGWEQRAAMKIQAGFRGYLARKALRALKGLVKLQARVRGFLVRRRAAETLLSMQALIRTQATMRKQRERRIQSDIHPFIERVDDNTRRECAPSFHSRRLSASFEAAIGAGDESPKTVQIDTCRNSSRTRRTNPFISDCREKDCSFIQSLSSPLPCKMPSTKLSAPSSRNLCGDFNWVFNDEGCRYPTAQSTPRFLKSSEVNAAGVPVTPTRSLCGESYFHYLCNHPNYMANTQSSRAKVRSHSAPKQRHAQSPKRGLCSNEMESRTRSSGIDIRRSCSHVHEAFSFKNAVIERLDRSSEFVKEAQRDSLHRRWAAGG